MSLRIDYLSPLPPVRSGISDYSVDLLPELSALADVRVLRLPGLPTDDEIARRFAVEVGAERAGEEGRLPLYQMGNNRYHAAIRELAMARPGVVVLHDLVLHHALLDRTVGHGDQATYAAELERDHGWIGAAMAEAVRWGAFGQAGQFELAANRTLVARQRGVVVHGAWAAERLLEQEPRLAVRVVPMAIPLPPPVDAARGREFRARHAIPETAPLVGSFGFQTPIKRTDVAIRALARPELAQVHLLIAGELSPYANFVELADRLGVAARVHVTGFLPFAELDAAIAATDLCLNLRYPSAGETSASLLRILAVGRPVIVSDYADFTSLPSDVALLVPLGDDEEERFAALVAERLAGGRASLLAMGEAARAHVAAHHDPRRSARALVDAVAELAALEPLGDSAPRVEPNRSISSTAPRGAITIAGSADWPRGARRRLEITVENRGQDVWQPSREQPGGVVFEPIVRQGGRDLWAPRPWLELGAPVAPGERVTFALPLRRPLEPAELLIVPKIATGDGFVRFGSEESFGASAWL